MRDDESQMLHELYDALMRPQPGEKEALLARLARMQRDWSRMTWLSRAVLVVIAGLGGVLAGWEKLLALLGKIKSGMGL